MLFEGMNRHPGLTNTPATFHRCSRRMPGFEAFWFSCRTSSAETSITNGCGTYGATFLNKGFRRLYEFIESGLVQISGLPMVDERFGRCRCDGRPSPLAR